MADTKIDWATKVWNPVTGCTPVGAGCDNCYAARMAKRLRGRHGYPADDPFRVSYHPRRLEQPVHWRKPQVVFVNSMSDLFHKNVPITFLARVMDVIFCKACRHHQFVVLTKRPERVSKFQEACLLSPKKPGNNLWIGASIWDQKSAERALPHVLKQTLGHPILCAEPLLGPIKGLDFGRLDWLIVGCESGAGRRPCADKWLQDISTSATLRWVPTFIKQRVVNGRVSRDPQAWPVRLRVRQLPWVIDARRPARPETRCGNAT